MNLDRIVAIVLLLVLLAGLIAAINEVRLVVAPAASGVVDWAGDSRPSDLETAGPVAYARAIADSVVSYRYGNGRGAPGGASFGLTALVSFAGAVLVLIPLWYGVRWLVRAVKD